MVDNLPGCVNYVVGVDPDISDPEHNPSPLVNKLTIFLSIPHYS
jgi:hypothetical protein